MIEFVAEYWPLILAVVALFVLGLVLGLRTEGGRDRLAAAAVQLAVAALALAERWLNSQVEATGVGSIQYAQGELRLWLAERSETGQNGAGS